MTLENWQEILFNCLRSEVNSIISILYLFSWIFLGNYVLLNLILAILLDGFNFRDDEESEEIENENEIIFSKMISNNKVVPSLIEKSNNEILVSDFFENDENNEKITFQEFKYFEDNNCDESLFLLSKTNKFRKFSYFLIKHPYFDNLILIIIIISSLKLAVDSYISPTKNLILNFISNKFDYFFTIVFTLEALIKSIALGFIMNKGSYLRESWSQLDFIIVCFSLVDLSLDGTNLTFIKILRLVRILRPLRFISHNQNMKIIVNALIESFGAIFNVVIVILMIW